jgi:hypothetical protein
MHAHWGFLISPTSAGSFSGQAVADGELDSPVYVHFVFLIYKTDYLLPFFEVDDSQNHSARNMRLSAWANAH